MRTYLIAYDLRQPGRDYKTLFQALKSYGTWWHGLESTWMIRTAQSAEQIRDYLLGHMDRNDRLMVTGLTGEAAWCGLDAASSNWIHQQLAA